MSLLLWRIVEHKTKFLAPYAYEIKVSRAELNPIAHEK